jgi:hypothetical protein
VQSPPLLCLALHQHNLPHKARPWGTRKRVWGVDPMGVRR